jgi:hypothetical protein
MKHCKSCKAGDANEKDKAVVSDVRIERNLQKCLSPRKWSITAGHRSRKDTLTKLKIHFRSARTDHQQLLHLLHLCCSSDGTGRGMPNLLQTVLLELQLVAPTWPSIVHAATDLSLLIVL